jgi:DNA-binding NtrC family response regulator
MNGDRILVADDDASIRQTFARVLARVGYEVETVESAERAIRSLGEREIALVISDLRIPGMSGLELLDWTRSHFPDIDVIIVTAHEDMETVVQAIKAGAYDYIVKPLDLDALEIVVARCFRDRTARRRAQRLQREAAEAAEPFQLRRLIGRDPKMIALSKTIGALAASRAPALIRGETGTGKEVVARTIHYNSDGRDEPFIAVNCTAIPEPLLESELFGHMRGAFTGATSDRRGRFELAGAGTIFLDEIGDVSPAFQAKLLRVLQDGEFYPVGSERARRTAARVLAATHRPLEQLVASGAFREDLYFRLRVVEVVIPPLRERRGDVLPIAEALLARIARELHRPVTLSAAARRAIERYSWPGNVRELENAITRAAVLAPGAIIGAAELSLESPMHTTTAGGNDLTLDSVVVLHARHVLDVAHGNKRKAARLLGVSRQRLDRILERGVAENQNPGGHETLPNAFDNADEENGKSL